MEGEANFCVMKRIEANDPVALWQMGESTHLKGDYSSAFGYWTKAAELGNVGAHCSLADMNHHGIGVQKDEKKKVYHFEEAAIGGDIQARHNLGVIEGNNGRYERALKDWIIAANLGVDHSMKVLWTC